MRVSQLVGGNSIHIPFVVKQEFTYYILSNERRFLNNVLTITVPTVPSYIEM